MTGLCWSSCIVLAANTRPSSAQLQSFPNDGMLEPGWFLFPSKQQCWCCTVPLFHIAVSRKWAVLSQRHDMHFLYAELFTFTVASAQSTRFPIRFLASASSEDACAGLHAARTVATAGGNCPHCDGRRPASCAFLSTVTWPRGRHDGAPRRREM